VSVYMSLRLNVDPENVRKVAQENNDTLKGISERAKGMGCIHHTFASENGSVVVMDEWESREAFQKFFESDEDIPKLMQAAGVTSEPEIHFYEPMNLGDEF
jgi:heme-degrading monooxygenase HmoA